MMRRWNEGPWFWRVLGVVGEALVRADTACVSMTANKSEICQSSVSVLTGGF